MLELRCAIKEDLNATVSEMVYGTTIAIPGDMFVQSKFSVKTPGFVKSLKETFANVRAEEPFLVTKLLDKTKVNNVSKVVSVNRLKHAFTEDDNEPVSDSDNKLREPKSLRAKHVNFKGDLE